MLLRIGPSGFSYSPKGLSSFPLGLLTSVKTELAGASFEGDRLWPSTSPRTGPSGIVLQCTVYCRLLQQYLEGRREFTHPIKHCQDISQEWHRLLVYFWNVVCLCLIWSHWTAGLLAGFFPLPFLQAVLKAAFKPTGFNGKGSLSGYELLLSKMPLPDTIKCRKKKITIVFWAGFQELACCFLRYVRHFANKPACCRGRADNVYIQTSAAFGIGASGS